MFLSKSVVVFDLARRQPSAALNYRVVFFSRSANSQWFNASVTHHPLILLTFNDLEQVEHVLVEIKDLRAQLEVGVA